MDRPYVVIAGHGRSGTNFLLRILDLSPLTHCRNEPNEIASSPFQSLPSGTWRGVDDGALNAGWDEAVRWTTQRIGEDEHRVTAAKHHIYRLPRRLGLHRVLMDPELRRIRAILMPRRHRGEWLLPWWLGSRRTLSDARVVLKLNTVPGWACFLLKKRPEALVIHIVRHPGGFLNSWRNRWLNLAAASDPEERKAFVLRRNQQRLRRLRELEPEWSQRFGDIDRMSVEESELWYWRYATEIIHFTGQTSEAYTLIKYEDLSSDCVDVARTIYAACDLPWDGGIAQAVIAMTTDSSSIAGAWRSKITESDRELLRRVMSGSPLELWWD